jgi:hypothetical protein
VIYLELKTRALQRVNACARACAGVRARRANDTARLGVGHKGGDATGNAAELGPAPWVAADKRACEGAADGGKACTWRPRERRSLPCDRMREAPDHSEAVVARSTKARRRGPAQEKGTKGLASPPGWRARVLGCTLARERRARADTRVNANAPARDCERGQHGVALDGEKD